jgi:hypothetical protein
VVGVERVHIPSIGMFLQALVKAGVFSVSGWRPRFGWTTLCVALQRGEGLIQSGVAPDLTVGVAPALQKRPGGVRGQNPDRLGSTAPKGLNTLAQGNALGARRRCVHGCSGRRGAPALPNNGMADSA